MRGQLVERIWNILGFRVAWMLHGTAGSGWECEEIRGILLHGTVGLSDKKKPRGCEAL